MPVKSEHCWIFAGCQPLKICDRDQLRLFVFLIKFLFDSRELTAFELGDLDRFPSFGSADERVEHELQDGPLAECIRDDLQTPAFLDEQAFSKFVVRMARRCVTGNRRCAIQASKSSMKQVTALSCRRP